MTEAQARINDALETVWLTVLDAPARALALAPFGEAVAGGVEAIYRETMSEPPRGEDEDGGQARVERTLREKYPWLGDRARRNLVTAYLYSWK